MVVVFIVVGLRGRSFMVGVFVIGVFMVGVSW